MNHSPETISEALSYVPSEDRETWCRMGMAVRDELGDEGFALWDSWSQSADSYNAADARTVWRSFKPGGGITIATLIYEAKSHGWKNGRTHHIDAQELERFRQEAEARKRLEAEQRVADQAKAAEEAERIWNAATPAASFSYLTRKGVRAVPGLRIGSWPQRDKSDCLLVPMRDSSGRLWSLQAYFPEPDAELGRDRDHLFAGKKQGCYFSIGGSDDQIILAEGLATALSVYEATGSHCCVCFDRGNLAPVAEVMREKFPDRRIIFAADNDIAEGKPNYGLEAAIGAARSINGLVAVPHLDGKRVDFNDLHQSKGLEAVSAAIREALPPIPKKLEIASPAASGLAKALSEIPLEAYMADPAIRQQHQEPSAAWPQPLNLEELAAHRPETPRFIFQDWMPCGYAVLLAGHGGAGKSSIALHFAVCAAADVPFFGQEIQRRRVLYLSCEDRQNILHWRLERICRYAGVDMAALKGWLNVLDLVGHDAILWNRHPQTGFALTPAFGRLAEAMRQTEAELLVVDGVSDTFGGNENARPEVKSYVNALVSLIPPDSGSVLIVGHVPKTSATNPSTNEGYSGSTGWHNSVRARWYLYPETEAAEDSDRLQRTGSLLLELQKSNLGKLDGEMRFTWEKESELFVGQVTTASAFDAKHQDREERRGLLLAFKGCAEASLTVPAAMQGPSTAYLTLSLRPEFPASLKGPGGQKRKRFRRQIEELRQSRAIEDNVYRRGNRHEGRELRITTEGLRQCA